MNPFEFVLGVLIIIFGFAILKHKFGIPDRRQANDDTNVGGAENQRLRGQVQQLQERIRVLERIVTDRGVETASQIEALRDRDRISEGDEA